MRKRLTDAGLSVYAHKAKTEMFDEELTQTHTQKSPQSKPNEPREKDTDDKPDKDEEESADSFKDATCSNAYESQPESVYVYDQTHNKNWFGKEF